MMLLQITAKSTRIQESVQNDMTFQIDIFGS